MLASTIAMSLFGWWLGGDKAVPASRVEAFGQLAIQGSVISLVYASLMGSLFFRQSLLKRLNRRVVLPTAHVGSWGKARP